MRFTQRSGVGGGGELTGSPIPFQHRDIMHVKEEEEEAVKKREKSHIDVG